MHFVRYFSAEICVSLIILICFFLFAIDSNRETSTTAVRREKGYVEEFHLIYLHQRVFQLLIHKFELFVDRLMKPMK